MYGDLARAWKHTHGTGRVYKNERAFFELNSGMTKKIREKVTSSFSKNYLKFFKITQTQERERMVLWMLHYWLRLEIMHTIFLALPCICFSFFLLFFNLKLCEMTKLKGFELSWVYRPSNKLCCQHINSLQISSLPGDTDRKFCVECNVIKTTLVKKIVSTEVLVGRQISCCDIRNMLFIQVLRTHNTCTLLKMLSHAWNQMY